MAGYEVDMGHHEEPAALASHLRTLGYTTDDVAGCVRVRLSRGYGVTIECEPDRVRFVLAGTSLGMSLLGFLFALAANFSLLFFIDTASTAAIGTGVLAAAWSPLLVYHIVRCIEAENTIDTLRLLIALKRTAEPANRVDTATAGRVARAVGLR